MLNVYARARSRGLRCCTAVALAAAFMSVMAGVSAQSISPYYADTNVYDTPRFYVVDSYTPTTGTCFSGGDYKATVDADRVRFAFPLMRSMSCAVPQRADFKLPIALPARLPYGRYNVEFGYDVEGTWIPRASTVLNVEDGQDRCSRTANINDIRVTTTSSTQATRLTNIVEYPSLNPAVFETLGRPYRVHRTVTPYDEWNDDLTLFYHPLVDTDAVADRMRHDASLGIRYASRNEYVCALNPPLPLRIVEFYNRTLDHYFMATKGDEIAAIEHGDAGPGWQRTGESVDGFESHVCSRQDAYPATLFRFYGTPGRGPNSHFFTADRRECGQVRNDPGWTFESVPFSTWAPINGRCPAQSIAMTRLFNQRAAQNDSNHRYVSKGSLVAEMTAKGWASEGIAFCVMQR